MCVFICIIVITKNVITNSNNIVDDMLVEFANNVVLQSYIISVQVYIYDT